MSAPTPPGRWPTAATVGCLVAVLIAVLVVTLVLCALFAESGAAPGGR